MNTSSPDRIDIRSRRKAAGLTQSQAAQMVYRSLRAWQEWEAGRRNMPAGLWALFVARTPSE